MSAPVTEDYRDQIAAVFVAHQRAGIAPCMCGLMRLGQSYPHHLADALSPVMDSALLESYGIGHADGQAL